MADTGWCPECHSTQVIEDAYVEDTGDSRVHVEVYWVTNFECGHQTSVKTSEYRSPLQQAGALPRSHSLPDRTDGDL